MIKAARSIIHGNSNVEQAYNLYKKLSANDKPKNSNQNKNKSKKPNSNQNKNKSKKPNSNQKKK